MTTRRLGLPVVAVALAVALVACAGAPAPRTTPNAVERAALAGAGAVVRPPAGAPVWRQLWTVAQAGPVVERCISRLSHGVVRAQVTFTFSGVDLSYDYGALGGVSSADVSRYGSTLAAQRLADGCLAATPVDERIDYLPRRDRGALYSYDVTVLRHCLLEHGQPVGRIPSRATFETLLDQRIPWSPYDHVVVADRAAWFALSDACPVFPLLIDGDIAAVTTAATTP